MKLVEAESEGPVEGDDALVTPPRPPHRRVSVSLLLTLSVLVGLVVTIYAVFPLPRSALASEAIRLHRTPPKWDLQAPSPDALRAWAIGVLGPGADVPDLPAIGAARVRVLEHDAAVIRFRDTPEMTYVIARPEHDAPERSERRDSGVAAVTAPCGAFSCITVR